MTAITSAAAGFYDVGSTWTGGVVPALGDTVTILHNVTLRDARVVGSDPGSVTNPANFLSSVVFNISTNGILTFSRTASSSLTVYGSINLSTSSSVIDMGTDTKCMSPYNVDSPIPAGITATIRFASAGNLTPNKYSLKDTVGTGVKFYIRGVTCTTNTVLSAGYSAGAGSIVVADTTGWAVGDRIAIHTSDSSTSHIEIFGIKAIAGTTVTLGLVTAPATAATLAYAHIINTPCSRISSNVTIGGSSTLLTSISAQVSGSVSGRQAQFLNACFEYVTASTPYSGSDPSGWSVGIHHSISYTVDPLGSSYQYINQCSIYNGATGTGGFLKYAGKVNSTYENLAVYCTLSSSVCFTSSQSVVTYNNCVAYNPQGTGKIGQVAYGLSGYRVFNNCWFVGVGVDPNDQCPATYYNNCTFGAFVRPVTIDLSIQTFTNCNFGTFGTTGINTTLISASSSTVGNINFNQCNFVSGVTIQNQMQSLGNCAAQSYARLLDYNNDPTQQQQYILTGSMIRDNSQLIRSRSSIKLSPLIANTIHSSTYQVSATAGIATTMRFGLRYDTNYGTGTPPSVTVSGLGVTPQTFTAGGSANTDYQGTITVTPTISGSLAITASGQSTLTTGNFWFSGMSISPWITWIQHYGYTYNPTAPTVIVDPVVVLSETAASALTGITVSGSNITVSSSHTISELYDYLKYWEASNYLDPLITSSDGIHINLASGCVCNITGGSLKDTSKVFGGTLAITSGGYFEDMTGAIWDVSGILYYASAFSFTFKDGATAKQFVECYLYDSSNVNRTYNTSRAAVTTLTSNSSGVVSGYIVYKIGSTTYTGHTLKARLYGYTTYTAPKTVAGLPISSSEELSVDLYLVDRVSTVSAFTGMDLNYSTFTISTTATHSILHWYEYIKYNDALSANLAYPDTVLTIDGVSFLLANNWSNSIVGGQLSDVAKKIVYQGTGSLSVSSAGYFEDITGAVWSVSGVMYYASAISFTFDYGSTPKQNVNCYVYESGGINLVFDTSRTSVAYLSSDSAGNVKGYVVYKTGSTTYTGHTLKARLYGYNTYSVPKTITGTFISSTEQLSQDALCTDSSATVSALTGLSINYTSNTITVASNISILQLYEYLKLMDAGSSSLTYTDTMSTTDGVSFSLLLNWSLLVSGGQVADVNKKLTYQGTGSLSLVSSGYYEDILGAAWDTGGVTYLASAISHLISIGSTVIPGVHLAYYSSTTNMTYGSNRLPVSALTTDSVGQCSGYVVYKIGSTNYFGQNLISKQYGYKKSIIPKTVTGSKINDAIQLTVDAYVSNSYTSAGLITGSSIVSNTSITLSSGLNLQNLYDNTQWWSYQASNLSYDEPLSLTDGTNVSIDSLYTMYPANYITIDSKVLTGSTIELTSVGSYSLLVGTTSLVFTAASGTYDLRGSTILGTVTLINTGGGFLNVKLPYGTSVVTSGPNITIELSKLVTVSIPNLVAGTRVQLYDLDNSVELDNSVVSGTDGYSYTHTYTGDKNIRVKACYQVGTAANYPIDEVGLISISGLTLLTTQVVDPFYAAIGIDGSVVDSANGGEITANYAHIEISLSSTLGVMDARRAISWWRYITQTTAGISNYDPGALTYAPDEYNIVIDGPLLIANVNSAALTIVNGVWVRADGISIIDPTSNTIIWVPDGRVYTASDSRASLTVIKNNTNLIPALL